MRSSDTRSAASDAMVAADWAVSGIMVTVRPSVRQIDSEILVRVMCHISSFVETSADKLLHVACRHIVVGSVRCVAITIPTPPSFMKRHVCVVQLVLRQRTIHRFVRDAPAIVVPIRDLYPPIPHVRGRQKCFVVSPYARALLFIIRVIVDPLPMLTSCVVGVHDVVCLFVFPSVLIGVIVIATFACIRGRFSRLSRAASFLRPQIRHHRLYLDVTSIVSHSANLLHVHDPVAHGQFEGGRRGGVSKAITSEVE